MNFDLGRDELALQRAIRDLCRDRFALRQTRPLAGAGGVDRAAWRTLGEAGVFSLRLPESAGGVGLGTPQAAVVFEELGAALVGGPLIATHLAAGHVDGAAVGERVVGLLEADTVPLLVEYPQVLDDLLVLDAGTVCVAASGWAAEPVAHPLDPLTPMARMASVPTGRLLTADADDMRRTGAVLTSAMLVGIAAATTEAAVAYAADRHQFGRPIGSFQAVKHLCADMLVRAEVARAAVHAAAVTLDDPGDRDTARAVAAATIVSCEAALANAKTCIQVHGGMGFTWEVDAHLYLKRAAVLSTHFGGPDEHAERLAATM